MVIDIYQKDHGKGHSSAKDRRLSQQWAAKVTDALMCVGYYFKCKCICSSNMIE